MEEFGIKILKLERTYREGPILAKNGIMVGEWEIGGWSSNTAVPSLSCRRRTSVKKKKRTM